MHGLQALIGLPFLNAGRRTLPPPLCCLSLSPPAWTSSMGTTGYSRPKFRFEECAL